MTGSWRPGDTVPDRWLLKLEAGDATLEETAAALADYEWPDATPANMEVNAIGGVNPFPPGSWPMTMDAAFADGRITPEQYEAVWDACGPARGRKRA